MNTLDRVCTVKFVEFYYINQQTYIEFNDDTEVSNHVGVLHKYISLNKFFVHLLVNIIE